jgi:hypothetical protein
MKQLKTPGRMHRLKRYMSRRSCRFMRSTFRWNGLFRGVQCAVGFRHRADDAADRFVDRRPATPGSVVHARLITPLTFCTLAEGRSGGGSYIPAAPGWHSGEGRSHPRRVQSGKDANVKLDSEGDAEANNAEDSLPGHSRVAHLGGRLREQWWQRCGQWPGSHSRQHRCSGCRRRERLQAAWDGAWLVVHSRALGCTMGAYGAGMSVYPGFFARGREVVFPKYTVMEIGVGRRQEGTAGTASRTSAAAAVARN